MSAVYVIGYFRTILGVITLVSVTGPGCVVPSVPPSSQRLCWMQILREMYPSNKLEILVTAKK